MQHTSDKNSEYMAKIAKGDAIGDTDVSKAASYYEQAFEMNPNNPDPLIKKYELTRFGTNEDDILEDTNRLVSLFPEHAMSYVARGEMLSSFNQHDDAVEDLSFAIKLDPNFTRAYKNNGYSLIALGCHEEAEKMYRKAVQLSPDDVEAVYYLCYELEELGRYNDALAVLESYLPLDKKNNYSVYRHFGRVHGLLGNMRESFENYLRSVKLNKPGKDGTPFMEKRYREITETHKKIEKMNPLDPESFVKAGLMLQNVGWYGTNIDMLKTAADLIHDPEYSDIVGLAYMSISEFPGAIKYFKRAMEMDQYSKGDLEARYVNLIICLFGCGRHKELIKWTKKAHSLNIKNLEIDMRYNTVMKSGPDVQDMDQVAGGWTIKSI